MMTTLIIGGFIAISLMGAPLFSVIAGIALYCFYLGDIPLMGVINEMYRLTDQEIFITLPLFTFAGVLMSHTDMPGRLLRFSRACLGWMPGGLSMVAILICTLITAFTGVTGVTIVSVGVLLYPALQSAGYDKNFSLGLLTSSGSLGLLIPPAIPLILFAIVAEISPNKLFLAGALPMLLIILVLCAYSVKTGLAIPRTPFSRARLWQSLWAFRYELPIFIIVPAGIFSGLMTAVEAASVMAFLVLVVEVFILREIPLRDFTQVAKKAMTLIGGILLIVMASLATSGYLIQEDVPHRMFAFLQQYIHTKIGFLLLLNGFLLILGCMLDIFSSIMIVVPLILPIAERYGVDFYHLGIIFLVNMQIGYSTPPLGMNLFIASQSFKEPVVTLFRATLPFLLMLLGVLLLITYVPSMSLCLLSLLP